jgi:hypothetical protein
MKYLLLAASLALASCTRHNPPPAPTSEPIAQQAPPKQPAGVIVQPPRNLLDKLTGRTPEPQVYPPGTPVYAGKRSTITVNNNHVAGNQANTSSTTGKNGTSATGAGATATQVEKTEGPVATGPGDATDNRKQGQRGGAAASAPGAVATATTVKPGLPWGRIAAGVVGGGFLIWVLFGGGGAVLLARMRRKSSTPNQA